MSRTSTGVAIILNTTLFLILLAGAALLRTQPTYFDYPVARAINKFATGREFVNKLTAGAAYPTVEGVIALSLVWCCWFSGTDPEPRVRLAYGIVAAVIATVLAHFLQQMFPSALKPIFDPALNIHPLDVLGNMDVVRATANTGGPNFPTERGTLFAGLAIAVFLAHPAIGLIALACTICVECCRIYLGLHYPSDIMGSFFLAASVVCFAEAATGLELGRRLLVWESILCLRENPKNRSAELQH